MKKLIMILFVLGLVNVAAAGYVEKFDSDNASWNYGYGTDFMSPQLAATWNPGGYISGASQNLYAVWTYVTAPYGDMTGLTLTIDTKVTDGETGNAQFYVGRGGTYFIDGAWAIGNDTGWTTHTAALDSSNFTPWTGVNNNVYTLAEVLQAPDDIGIFFGGGLANGTGNLLVDNYGTVPEPATMCLLGLGALSLIRRKRKA